MLCWQFYFKIHYAALEVCHHSSLNLLLPSQSWLKDFLLYSGSTVAALSWQLWCLRRSHVSRNPVTRHLTCTIHCGHHRAVDVSNEYDSGDDDHAEDDENDYEDYDYADQSIEGNEVIKVFHRINLLTKCHRGALVGSLCAGQCSLHKMYFSNLSVLI